MFSNTNWSKCYQLSFRFTTCVIDFSFPSVVDINMYVTEAEKTKEKIHIDNKKNILVGNSILKNFARHYKISSAHVLD